MMLDKLVVVKTQISVVLNLKVDARRQDFMDNRLIGVKKETEVQDENFFFPFHKTFRCLEIRDWRQMSVLKRQSRRTIKITEGSTER